MKKWGHWFAGIDGPHLQTFPEEPRFTVEPSLSRPVGKSFPIHPDNQRKSIADLEKIYEAPKYETLK